MAPNMLHQGLLYDNLSPYDGDYDWSSGRSKPEVGGLKF